MSKQEIRLHYNGVDELKDIIEKAYYKNGDHGKIVGKCKHYLTIKEDVNISILTGLDKSTIKLVNNEVIDGTMRFMVDESQGEIRLYPISIYTIKEEEKYSFY